MTHAAGRTVNVVNVQKSAVTTDVAQGVLTLDAGKGSMLHLLEDAVSVFVADPNVADVQVPSPRAVFVLGKKAGSATLYALGANSKPIFQRTVVMNRDMLKARFPNINVEVAGAQGSLVLTGQVQHSTDADAIVQAVTPMLGDKEVLINRMTVERPLQVQLRVRITEVDRNVTQQWGINWQAMGSAADSWYSGTFSGRQIYNYNQPITTSSGGTTYPINLAGNKAFSMLAAFKRLTTRISERSSMSSIRKAC